MGIPGAGKNRVAEGLAAQDYLRLNRDKRGGSLRQLATALDDALASGERQVVLDNTYLTRASRSHVVETAAHHGLAARCVWLDTPLAQAQVNMVERLLDRFGSLPTPDELREAREAGLLTPTSQMRAFRELEPPTEDEGFAAIEQIRFERAPREGRAGVFVGAAVLQESGWEDALGAAPPEAPHLVFDWAEDASRLPALAERLATVVAGSIETAVCPHGGGPPICWCRPPLPGLPLAFARRHDVDPARSFLVGASPAHRTLATALGARYVDL
jgi:hypothetical protein